MLAAQRLKQQGRAHRFAHAEDAIRMLAFLDPVNPQMNVIRLTQPVSSDAAAALAVCSRVWHQNGVPVPRKKLCIARHSQPIVSYAMQKQNCIAVTLCGHDSPGAEWDSVAC